MKKRLGHPIKEQLKKKLAERLENPHVPSARLSGRANRYKIKLKSSGYCLVYEVNNGNKIILLAIAIGKRAGDAVYTLANER
ncbi:RelE toxin [Photorhabdus luminescens subsp. luminescens]|uniref:type II toxin-antitoxin system RelE family toxin n=1 Tax=Photorhabdus TaxID=29487 RepID=UPI00066CC50B|nr:type II toxin-antitoxin system RelE/ParE family toxin [Photorhabdus luminescens]KMW74812.1 RelE toxin [Photorhabdus luminescens subsp. luminescens]